MTIEVLTLCDFAQDTLGKLTIIGAFDAITVREFPASHPLMSIAARIRFAIYELGDHQIHIEIKDANGSDLAPPLDGQINVNGIGGDSACTNLTLNLMNIQLTCETSWRITLSIDGQERAHIPLFIRKVNPVQIKKTP